MELKTAIEILEYHQEWRLGKREDMIHEPKKLTQALDIVLSEVKKFCLGAVVDSLPQDNLCKVCNPIKKKPSIFESTLAYYRERLLAKSSDMKNIHRLENALEWFFSKDPYYGIPPEGFRPDVFPINNSTLIINGVPCRCLHHDLFNDFTITVAPENGEHDIGEGPWGKKIFQFH